FRETNLADAMRKAAETYEPVLSDMALYPPAGNSPQMFVVHLIEGLNGLRLGYVALGISPDPLEAIKGGLRSGMGETGATHLVGPDMLMRTSSHLLDEDTILLQAIDTEPVHRALAGETHAMAAVDYRGEPIFVAFAPLDVGNL